MRKFILVMVCGFFSGGAVAAESTATLVTAADARVGPGAYYSQTAKLLPGAKVRTVEQRGDWVLAEVQSARGWIPRYVLASEQSSDVGRMLRSASKSVLRAVTQLLQGNRGPAYLTQVQAAAGIRGFAAAYSQHRGLDAEGAPPAMWETAAFEAPDYDAFVAQRFAGRDWEDLKRRLPLDSPAPLPSADGDRLGAALAGVLAQQHRIRRDPKLERYLSLVATLVAASSHAIEVPFRVYVLAAKEPLGYITPNGIIFVSDGALAKMRNEAEFAFFVGHEIAHIAFGHGQQKMERDEGRHQQEAAFAEMEDDLGWAGRSDDKYVRTNAELSELADQVHDYFQREDNDADELEADRWGLVYAARAGYVPEAAEGVLLRMAVQAGSGGTGLLWRGTDAEPRLAQYRRTVTTITIEREVLRSFVTEYALATGNKKPAGE